MFLRVSRSNFQKNQAVYEELPLYELRERHTTAEGKAFLEKIIKSCDPRHVGAFLHDPRSRRKAKSNEAGCALRFIAMASHAQFKDDPECKLYRIFAKQQSKTGDTREAKQKIKAKGRVSARAFVLAGFEDPLQPAMKLEGRLCQKL